MTTSVTEMSRWCYVQTDQENPTQSVEVVEIMEDFQEEVTLEMSWNDRGYSDREGMVREDFYAKQQVPEQTLESLP